MLVFGLLQCPAVADEPVEFNRDIRPLLSARCFHCHGPDAQQRQADLRLDTRDGATVDRDGSFAIVPGKPEQSSLFVRITSRDDDERMPPADVGAPLTAQEQDLFHRWIAQGADYQQHWAFVPPVKAALPQVSEEHWVRNPIDYFVLARLDQEGLKPAAAADRHTLIRRLALALTGLPPTLPEVDDFVSDRSENAYEALVSRYLNSSAYGERWAAVWLDLARYADSAGYAQDPVRTIWPYRDWVIRAINRNLSFKQFTIEQIAGDLLPDPTQEQLVATGFHRNTMTNSEGGTDNEEFRNVAVVDRVNTTMQVWMGITMGCAQCHEHKYDPISNEEYFRFFAILNNTKDSDKQDEHPTIPIMTAERRQKQQSLQRQIDELKRQIADRAAKGGQNDHEQPTKVIDEKDPEQKQLQDLKKQLAHAKPYQTPIMRELTGENRRKTYIQVRGNFLNRGNEVSPGVPRLFRPLPESAEPPRLALANWLVDRQNPLTARVVVNRYWDQLFGRGLVATHEDFGNQGTPPTHPQLLDYLAVEFMEHNWDPKWLVRQIVTSATYRQRSHATMALLERDRDNLLLARGPRFRLSAEMIRDQALAVAGLLSRKLYGPPVQPPRPKLGLRSAFGGLTDWTTSPGDDRYRRGLYTNWRRTTPYPSMTTFDAPSREFCAIRRIRTNTPLQALVTLNDPVYVEASQGLARRVAHEAGNSSEDRATYALRLCLARQPRAGEVDALCSLYQMASTHLADKPDDAKRLATEPIGPAKQGDNPTELAAWTVVSNVLMNLDEFLMRP
jgi:hypothetical protein